MARPDGLQIEVGEAFDAAPGHGWGRAWAALYEWDVMPDPAVRVVPHAS
jgi:hypothetical protein